MEKEYTDKQILKKLKIDYKLINNKNIQDYIKQFRTLLKRGYNFNNIILDCDLGNGGRNYTPKTYTNDLVVIK